MTTEERKKVYEETKDILEDKFVSETIFHKDLFETGNGNAGMDYIRFVDDESEKDFIPHIPGKRSTSDGISVWLYVDGDFVMEKPIEEVAFFVLKSGERVRILDFEQQYLYGKSGKMEIDKYKKNLEKLVENQATEGFIPKLVDDYGQTVFWKVSEELLELFQRKCVYGAYSGKLIDFVGFVDPEDISDIETFPASDGDELLDIDPEYEGKPGDDDFGDHVYWDHFYKRAYFKMKDGSEVHVWDFENEHLHVQGVDGKNIWTVARFKTENVTNPKYAEFDEPRELCSMEKYMKAVEELVADRE